MSEAPERIWVTWPNTRSAGLAFSCQARPPVKRHEYIRAARIEELEDRLEKEMSDLDAADRRAKRLHDRIEELEAKLAKAIKTLTHIRDEKGWNVLHTRRAVSATIAELTGGTNGVR